MRDMRNEWWEVAVSRKYLQKSCSELNGCDVARLENVDLWNEPSENSLYFPAQTKKIVDTPDENR